MPLNSKYNKKINDESFKNEINRLTNQIWKLIPMRENEEDWNKHLQIVILELVGLEEIIEIDENLLALLEILEGLNTIEIDFSIFRKLVFESISLLRKLVP